jgi:large subunit ribosomal protein L28
MSKVCDVCGKGPSVGNKIIRHGLAKYKGGIGLHTTGITKRRFMPNLHTVHAQLPDGTRTHLKVCAQCIKNGRVTKA